MKLRILADTNIPRIAEMCAHLGDVQLFTAAPETNLRAELAVADVFLCRSTVKVNEALLSDSPVRFVATATSGCDHVDTEYLTSRGIAFASAPGSNALSVAEYVFTALFQLAVKRRMPLQGANIGIIGVGHVGAWVQHMAERLGMRAVLNDPPLRDITGAGMFGSLDEALSADIVTLHVPLTAGGPYPTIKMMDSAAFDAMRDGVIFINTSRGGVVDRSALLEAVRKGKIFGTVLDVWPAEPEIDPEMVAAADISTPHIAGHSWDGKLLGALMIYEKLCAFLGEQPQWSFPDLLPARNLELSVGQSALSDAEIIRGVLLTVLDLTSDDAALRKMSEMPSPDASAAFMNYRATYRPRREFCAWQVDRGNLQLPVVKVLDALGFS